MDGSHLAHRIVHDGIPESESYIIVLHITRVLYVLTVEFTCGAISQMLMSSGS
jgi:hypothetical protein